MITAAGPECPVFDERTRSTRGTLACAQDHDSSPQDEHSSVSRAGSSVRFAVSDQWLWLVVALLGFALLVDAVRIWGITNHHDLDVFLLAARRTVAHEDIYADVAPFQEAIKAGTFSMKDEAVVWPYAYAPLVALLFVPATWFPIPSVHVAWWLFNLGALWLGCWLILRVVQPKARGQVSLAGTIVVLLLLHRFEPAVAALRLGQVEILQFFCLAWMLHALLRRREALAGVLLGLAAGIKFFPLALVALLIWHRRWRAALWALGTAAATILGSFAVVGLDNIPRFLHATSMYGIGGAFAAFPLNQSLNGFFSRNLIQNVFSAPLKGLHLPWLARGLTLLSDSLIVLVSAWLTWHPSAARASSPEDQGQGMAIELALAVVALLLVSPHSQVYALVWSLVAFIVLALHLLKEPRSNWWRWGGFLAAYLLVGRHYVLFYPGITRFVQSHYLFGILILWGTCATILWRRGRRPGGRGLC